MIELRPHQREAVENMTNGCILWGGVSSGRISHCLELLPREEPQSDLVIITTARKEIRWNGKVKLLSSNQSEEESIQELDLSLLSLGTKSENSPSTRIASLSLTNNVWLVAELGPSLPPNRQTQSMDRSPIATPGDTWLDYAPVFIANGFYKNITEFEVSSCRLRTLVQVPKVRLYLDERVLEDLHEIKYSLRCLTSPTAERVVNYLEVGVRQRLFERGCSRTVGTPLRSVLSRMWQRCSV